MQQNLTVIEEVDLEKFVTETKHDGMTGFKPLLYVNESVVFLKLHFIFSYFVHFLLQMYDKPLQKKILFLKIAVLWHGFCFVGNDILLLEGRIFNKEYVLLGLIARHECFVIKINTKISIIDDVPEPIFLRVIQIGYYINFMLVFALSSGWCFVSPSILIIEGISWRVHPFVDGIWCIVDLVKI